MTVPLSVPISALTPIPIPLRIGISAYLYLFLYLILEGLYPSGMEWFHTDQVPNLKDDEALLSKGHRINFHRRQWLHVRHEERVDVVIFRVKFV